MEKRNNKSEWGNNLEHEEGGVECMRMGNKLFLFGDVVVNDNDDDYDGSKR